MARATGGPRRRSRGTVESLPSGSLRVQVYAGIDPMTGKKIRLTETIPPGPRASADAEKARTRLLAQVNQRRAPRTRATVNELMDRYLQQADVERTTLVRYESCVRVHVRPLLGDLDISRLDGDVLDSFFATLRRCRTHCNGRNRDIEHRTAREHGCDARCRPHQCRPLANATLRKIHSCLNDACKRAVRWKWLGSNPVEEIDPPSTTPPDPDPPTAAQAAAISTAAWKDPQWGMLIWLAMVTGARRGELCALRWKHVDLPASALTVRKAVAQDGSSTWEKDTKTHQRRRITLDPVTVNLLGSYRQLLADQLAQVDAELDDEAFLFSTDPAREAWLRPSSVSQRYRRMCAGLGWDMDIKELRHYSATELIAAGVDVRTVAGRLGHGGGGTTTLRVYSAWRPEADRRAASTVSDRLPAPPLRPSAVSDVAAPSPTISATEPTEPTDPWRLIAADLRGAVLCGALKPGDQLPSSSQLANRYKVAASTAHRAVAELADSGLVTVSRGKRAIVSGQ
jgi:integrase